MRPPAWLTVPPMVLALTFSPAAYVRREWIPTGSTTVEVLGSRDRRLHGKARRRARQNRRN